MAASSEDVGLGGTSDLFTEPEGYFPPAPQPTYQTYTLLSGQTLVLHLVGHNPLWGHHLWNGARSIAKYLEANPSLVQNKTVLELGAGAGLPGLISGMLGAQRVVITDYPDANLVQNLWKNIDACHFDGNDQDDESKRVVAEGYCWGANSTPLLSRIGASSKGFDVLILADLLFNHSEHEKLVATIQCTLSTNSDSKALVFFTPYRPWLFEKDKAFFDVAKKSGLKVKMLLEEKHEKVMFEQDPGDAELRRTVFGYVLTWSR